MQSYIHVSTTTYLRPSEELSQDALKRWPRRQRLHLQLFHRLMWPGAALAPRPSAPRRRRGDAGRAAGRGGERRAVAELLRAPEANGMRDPGGHFFISFMFIIVIYILLYILLFMITYSLL